MVTRNHEIDQRPEDLTLELKCTVRSVVGVAQMYAPKCRQASCAFAAPATTEETALDHRRIR